MTRLILMMSDDSTTLSLARKLRELKFATLRMSTLQMFGEMLRAVDPDLIILDEQTKEVDVFDLLHQIRTQPRTKDVPVVILGRRHETPGKNLEGGAIRYLPGTSDSSKIVTAVCELLGINAGK